LNEINVAPLDSMAQTQKTSTDENPIFNGATDFTSSLFPGTSFAPLDFFIGAPKAQPICADNRGALEKKHWRKALRHCALLMARNSMLFLHQAPQRR
jgi:hypothetical protein